MVVFFTIKEKEPNEKTELRMQRHANKILKLASSRTVLFSEI